VRWYGYQCTYWAEGPENIAFAQVVLTVNGFVVGVAYGGGGNYVELSTYAEFQSSSYDQEVVCDGFSIAGSASARDMAPGLPDGESSQFLGWYEETFGRFGADLSPGNGPYSGRRVTERDPGGGWDTCWFDGSEKDYAGGITGGDWWVDGSNHYRPDFIGWGPEAILYYRAYDRAPCGFVIPQQMVMLVPGSQSHLPFEWPYKVNWLMSGFDFHRVWTQRDGVYGEIYWPF
jgi:hypothetical protein